jgi:hypothetical protein
MGYNRAGNIAKKKARRRKKEERRLAQKEAGPAKPAPSPGLLGTAKRAAKHVAEAVGEAAGKVKDAVTGKGKDQSG